MNFSMPHYAPIMGMTDEEPAPPASPRKGSPLEADQAVVQIVLNLPRYSIVAMEPLITVLQSTLQQHLGQGPGASSQPAPIRPLANRFRSDGGGKSNPSLKKLRLKQRLPLSNPQSAYHAVPAESDNMASKMLLPLETPDLPAGMEKDDAPNLVKATAPPRRIRPVHAANLALFNWAAFCPAACPWRAHVVTP